MYCCQHTVIGIDSCYSQPSLVADTDSLRIRKYSGKFFYPTQAAKVLLPSSDVKLSQHCVASFSLEWTNALLLPLGNAISIIARTNSKMGSTGGERKIFIRIFVDRHRNCHWSLSGVIIEHIGWQFAFYMVAVALGLFAVAWYFIVFDSPSKHPRITEIEREFILSKIGSSTTNERVNILCTKW